MAPRPRHPQTQKLPPYVYKAKGRYILRTYDPATQRQKETRLCDGTATMAQVWAAYDARHLPPDHGTFRWLSRTYLDSPQFAQLAAGTQRDYQGAHRRICAMELTDDRLLGDIPLSTWTSPLVQRWQDRRGKDAPVTCNREKSYMARVFAWGLARGHVTDNPVRAIPRLTEHARTRYVTDLEYTAALETAAASGTPYLVPVMELAYLLRARLAEVMDLQRTHLDADGILLHRRKGSRDSHIAWSPRLRAAVDAALAMHGQIAGRYLIQGGDYGRMKESTVQTAWQRLMVDWAAAGRERFTLHDLKAKGITDTKEGDKLAASGHRDPRMLAIYDRLPGRVTPAR
jgi:integrase